jgi:hypothetical protein
VVVFPLILGHYGSASGLVVGEFERESPGSVESLANALEAASNDEMVGVLSPGLGREQQDPHEEEDHTRDEDRRGWSPRPRLHVTAVPVVRGRGPGGDRPRVTRTGTDASRELTRPWVTRRSRVVCGFRSIVITGIGTA